MRGLLMTQPQAVHPAATEAADDPRSADIRRVAMVSLGCPKNLVDSEKMLGLLAEDGVLPVPADAMDAGEADAAIVNTCGFLEASKAESLEEIHKAAQLKKEGRLKRIVVAGCLVQRHRAKILEWCPDVDAIIGVFDRDRIVRAVRGEPEDRQQQRDEKVGKTHPLPVYSSIAANAGFARTDRGLDAAAAPGYFEDDAARLRLTPRHYAYLRVSEGCNQNCAFCTIPSIRGKMRSKPVDRLVAEARELIEDGAVELSLIGQDTTSYGEDIAYEAGLAGMLRELDAVAGDTGTWLRLMYAYPSCFTDEMIDAIAALPHVLKYIDMPLQHINDTVLDRMRRKTSRQLIETLLHKLRDRIPGMTIRTTFITGYPGETEDQHRELVEFVESFGFDAMGVFAYSPEPGTPAGRLHREDAVPEEVAQRRLDELMSAQQRVAFEKNRSLAEDAVEADVLIDAVEAMPASRRDPGVYVGRTRAQAPQIDGVTRVESREELAPGEIVACRMTDWDGYDLVARPVSDLQRKARLPLLRV